MDYSNLTKEELLLIIKDKDKQLDDLESDLRDKDNEIEKLEVTVSDLESELDDFKDLAETNVIILNLKNLRTDEIAKIYYSILDRYDFQHLDKFKPI